MTWTTLICFSPALVWTVISVAGYRDLFFAFRTSLIGWVICGIVWITIRRNFPSRLKSLKLPKKLKKPNRRRLAIAGSAVGIVVLIVMTAQWLRKNYHAGVAGLTTAVALEKEPRSTKPKSPVRDELKANRADIEKADAMWSVQVAAFRNEQDAAKLATVLKDRGWEAYVTSADVNAVTFYRIKVGRFRTRDAAERLLLKLKDKEAYTRAFVASM